MNIESTAFLIIMLLLTSGIKSLFDSLKLHHARHKRTDAIKTSMDLREVARVRLSPFFREQPMGRAALWYQGRDSNPQALTGNGF
jgi:hypothetical protein